MSIDFLTEVALLIQKSHAYHRNSEITCGFQLIAGDIAKSTGVNRQRLAEHVFHAKVRHSVERGIRVSPLKPTRFPILGLGLRQQLFHQDEAIRAELEAAFGGGATKTEEK